MNAKLLYTLLCSLACYAAGATPRVIWVEGPAAPKGGKAIHRMEILDAPAGNDWTLWFCQFRTPVRMMKGSEATIEHVSGTLYRVAPTAKKHGKDMILSYEARPLVNQCRAPEGFFLQKEGKAPVPVEVSYSYLPAEPVQSFTYTPVDLSAYDMIPRLKKVTPKKGNSKLGKPAVSYVKGKQSGWYRITLGGKVKVEAADALGAQYAAVTLENIRRNAGGQPVPAAVVEDWPDLPYRGIMLDVSRNFTTKENILTLIDIMAHYKATHLHLHLGDDEGWRLEIAGLPELTSYGAFRGIPVLRPDGTIDEPDALQPSYCGTLDRNAVSTGNGYYSAADFVEILRYAGERGIRVIPEFDMPGHSRAAIKAMERRAERTGDRSCLLSEPEDKSVYVSVQDYNDNAINVALPTTYTFIGKVFDAVIALYAEAGVPLEAIHVGGDEVPKGAWVGSPACQALMKKAGREDIEWLKDYFVGRVMDIAEARGVLIAGWQEIAQHLEPATFARLKKNLAYANLWAVSRGRDELAYTFANDGIHIVLSNSSNYYFDLAYNDSPLERGHSWAGFADERRSFSFLPYNMYRSVRWDDHRVMRDISKDGDGKPVLSEEGRPNIIGVQGQLWSETLRSFDHVTYYLFPKAVGLFERGWNAEPEWEETTVADDPLFMKDFDHFFSIVAGCEYPYYESLGISWHRN